MFIFIWKIKKANSATNPCALLKVDMNLAVACSACPDCCWSDLLHSSCRHSAFSVFCPCGVAPLCDCFNHMLFLKWAAGSLSCLETTMNRGELLCVCVSLSVCWHWKEGAIANLNQTMLMSRSSLIYSHIHHIDSYTYDHTLTVHQFNWLFLYSSSSSLFLSPPSPFSPSGKGDTANFQLLFLPLPSGSKYVKTTLLWMCENTEKSEPATT